MTDRIDLDKLLELEAKATADWQMSPAHPEEGDRYCWIARVTGLAWVPVTGTSGRMLIPDAQLAISLRNAARPLLLELKRSREALAAAEAFIAEELECRERSFAPGQNEYISSAREVLEKVRRARGGGEESMSEACFRCDEQPNGAEGTIYCRACLELHRDEAAKALKIAAETKGVPTK